MRRTLAFLRQTHPNALVQQTIVVGCLTKRQTRHGSSELVSHDMTRRKIRPTDSPWTLPLADAFGPPGEQGRRADEVWTALQSDAALGLRVLQLLSMLAKWRLISAALVSGHFASIEELEDAQFGRCAALQQRPDLICSTTCFHWWPKRIAKRSLRSSY